MKLGEVILLALSRQQSTDEEQIERQAAEAVPSALSLLDREYPNFRNLVTRRTVVDFGCGQGLQAIALVKETDCTVCGVDANPKHIKQALETARENGIPSERLTFSLNVTDEMKARYDVVISQNSMEHFPHPAATLAEMTSLLRDDGKLIITFGPPWFAPWGSHMHFFCRVPWVNILFTEKTVMNVRGRFRNDGATRYGDIESGLNKMTVSKFERLIACSGLKVEFVRLTCVKRMNALAKLPFIRELFINRISCILTR